MTTNNKEIRIHKIVGSKKDAIRVTTVFDIPAFLQDSIDIRRGQVYLVCAEGKEVCSLGSVIGYEKSEKTSSGYDCKHIANAATSLIEKNGVFYKKATVIPAQKISDSLPAFIEGADVRKNLDGSWTIKTERGESSGKPGKDYWVRYGTKEDGTPDANILTKTEKSYREYIVCDENGQDIGFLCELDPE